MRIIPQPDKNDKWKIRRFLGVGSWMVAGLTTAYTCVVTILIPTYQHTSNMIALTGVFISAGISYVVSATMHETKLEQYDKMYKRNV